MANPGSQLLLKSLRVRGEVDVRGKLRINGSEPFTNGALTATSIEMDPVKIGVGAQATGSSDTAVGVGAIASSNGTAFGKDSSGTGTLGSVGVGLSANATGAYSVALGVNADSTTTRGLAVGYNLTNNAVSSTLIGYGITLEPALTNTTVLKRAVTKSIDVLSTGASTTIDSAPTAGTGWAVKAITAIDGRVDYLLESSALTTATAVTIPIVTNHAYMVDARLVLRKDTAGIRTISMTDFAVSNVAGTVAVTAGNTTTLDPGSLAITAALGASTSNLIFSITGGTYTSVKAVLVISIHG